MFIIIFSLFCVLIIFKNDSVDHDSVNCIYLLFANHTPSRYIFNKSATIMTAPLKKSIEPIMDIMDTLDTLNTLDTLDTLDTFFRSVSTLHYSCPRLVLGTRHTPVKSAAYSISSQFVNTAESICSFINFQNESLCS